MAREGYKDRYRAPILFTSSGSASGLTCLEVIGSATKLVRVHKLFLSWSTGTALANVRTDTTKSTGGSVTAGVFTPKDLSSSPAATATMKQFTANPAAEPTGGGVIDSRAVGALGAQLFEFDEEDPNGVPLKDANASLSVQIVANTQIVSGWVEISESPL